MKNAAFVVLFIPLLQFFSSCSGDVENKTSLDSDSLYTVYKIDSIDNFYLVYASMQGMKYKIISEKASCGTSNEIKLNESYRLKLTSRRYYVDGIEVADGDRVGCVVLGRTATKVCMEDSINDLSEATNLSGLCIGN